MFIFSTASSRSGWLFSVALLLGLSFILAACSSDDDAAPADESQLSSLAASAPSVVAKTVIGSVITGGDSNLTLYTRPGDTAGENTCTDACAIAWPPLLTTETVGGTTGDYSIIDRGDGTAQWAYKNYPLYFYQNDAAEGDVSGNAVAAEWYAARPLPVTSVNTEIGETLAALGTTVTVAGEPMTRDDFTNFTLYVFADDTEGVSNCNGGCADNWPPLYADIGDSASGEYSVISRADGSQQWAYQQMPLYFYAQDTAPGDINGEGVGGVWSVATP